MNTNASASANTNAIVRFVAGAMVAAGLFGGGALGFAAAANASTATPQQVKHAQAAELQAHEASRPGDRNGARPTPPPPQQHRVQPASPTAPGERNDRERQQHLTG